MKGKDISSQNAYVHGIYSQATKKILKEFSKQLKAARDKRANIYKNKIDPIEVRRSAA